MRKKCGARNADCGIWNTGVRSQESVICYLLFALARCEPTTTRTTAWLGRLSFPPDVPIIVGLSIPSSARREMNC